MKWYLYTISLLCLVLVANNDALAQPYFQGINCGSANFYFTSPQGDIYEPDLPYSPGRGYGYIEVNSFVPTTVRIWGGDGGNDSLFFFRREGEFAYQFDVPSGTYAVDIYVGEKVYYWHDLRNFSIVMEEDTYADSLDIYQETGRTYILPLRYCVQCSDGALNIDFVPGISECVINAISVREISSDLTPPDQPQNFNAIGGYEMNILYWDWIYAEDLAGYNTYRREIGGAWDLLNAEINTQYRYIDSAAVVGTEYEYGATTIDHWGNESSLSNTETATAILDEQSQLIRFEQSITEENLLALNIDIWSEEWIDLDLTLGGIYYPGSEIRRRGNSTRTLDKANWKFNLPAGSDYNGRDRMNENSGGADHTLMIERMATESFDMLGCLNPLTQNVHMERNGAFIGVYLDVEQVNNDFLLRNGLSRSGNLYRVEERLRPLFNYQDYVNAYIKENNEESDHYDVIEFISWLNNSSQAEFEENVGDRIELDDYINMYTVLISLGNRDFHSEFYMYINPADNRWNFIARDLNESFEYDSLEINAGTSEAYFWSDTTQYNRLINRILTVDLFKYSYCKKLERFLNTDFSMGSITTRANDVHDEIEYDAHRDIYKHGWERPDSFDEGCELFTDFIAVRAQYLLDTIPDFIPNIDLAPCFRLNEIQSDNQATIADEMGDYDPWIEIYNLKPVELDMEGFVLHAGQDSWTLPEEAVVDEWGHLIIWLDGETGEGALHSSIVLTNTGGEISLESNQGTFVDLTTVPVLDADDVWGRDSDGEGMWGTGLSPTPGSTNNPIDPTVLVINELMADNETVIADPAGDFDDWIEIYNTSPTDTVPVGGLYLTDNLQNPYKWVLPDTTILPSGFLLVWCDDEVTQGKMHAAFKLRASGEEVGLYHHDGVTPIDTLTYPDQQEDMSWGRYPDGVDDWGVREPTPGDNNVGINDTQLNPSIPQQFSLSPNFPNPFNPSTVINFAIPTEAHVQLKVYNICGREVAVLKDEPMKAGYHRISFNGDKLSSGIYLFRMEADDFVSTRKMVLVK